MQAEDTGARPKEFATSTPLVRQRLSNSGVGTAVASRYEEGSHSRWAIQPREPTLSPRITKAKSKFRDLNVTRERLRLQQKEAQQQRIRI